jgi:hypothetical protein
MEKLNYESPQEEDKFSKIVRNFFGNDYTAKFYSVASQHEMVILASFHRCGNTLIRELLEGVTNIVTGSDDKHMTPYSQDIINRSPAAGFNFEKELFGNRNDSSLKFKGQFIIDQSIWIYKTHYPARKGKGIYEFDKILLVVRNPFDAIDSMFNLYITNSHSKSIVKEEYERLFHDWEGLVKEESIVWNKFYEYWYKFSTLNDAGIYIVRYENLITDTKNEMMGVLKFLLDYQILEETIIEKKLDDYLQNRRLVYKPRKGTNLHSLENYTKDQITFILENSIEMFYLFEYDIYLEELIKKYGFQDKYEEFVNCLKLENKTQMRRYTELNKSQIEKCKNKKYPFDYVHVPNRIKDGWKVNSEVGVLKYSENHRSGGRIARLSYEISKNVRIYNDEDKEKNSIKIKIIN